MFSFSLLLKLKNHVDIVQFSGQILRLAWDLEKKIFFHMEFFLICTSEIRSPYPFKKKKNLVSIEMKCWGYYWILKNVYSVQYVLCIMWCLLESGFLFSSQICEQNVILLHNKRPKRLYFSLTSLLKAFEHDSIIFSPF